MSEKSKENPKIETDLISLRKATKYCDYSGDYLKLRARQGKLKAMKIGRMWVTKKEWIEDYIKEMEECKENRGRQEEVKLDVKEGEVEEVGPIRRISPFPKSKLKPVLALSLILLLLFSSIALSKESLKNVLQDTIFYVQQTPKTINYVLKESKKSLASSLDSLNQSFINLAEVIKTTDYEDLKEPIPLFKEYFQWSVTNLKSLFVQKPKDLGRNILDYGNRISLKIVQGFKHQVLTFRKGGGRFVKQIKEGILEFGQAIKDLTLYIYNLALRTPDILVRRVTESIPTLAKKIVDFGSYTSNKLKKGLNNLVLEFQTQRKELKQFITRFWKRVPPKEPEKPILVEATKEEFEELKQEIERIKKEGLPAKEIIKEVEVSRITKVEPIKEITKEIKVLDDESLKRIRIALSQQETDVEKLKLAASLGYVNINFPPILAPAGGISVSTLGTITTGVWNASTITVPYGGTGLTSVPVGYTLIGDSSNALQATSALFIASDGNVGIGTTEPGTLLTLRRTDAGNVFAIRNTANTADTFTITDAGVVNLGTWQGTAIGTRYGGIGQDFSAVDRGNIIYFSGAGVMANLAPGVAGQFLQTQGAGDDPVWAAAGGGGAPTDAQYVTLAVNATLTDERVLTAGTNISFTDTGPDGTLTIATVANPEFAGLTLSGLSGVLKAAAGVVSGSATTSDLPEGTNLYFTDALAQAAITGGASTIVTSDLTINRALISSGTGKVAVSAVTATELGYVGGVTTAIQTQLDAKVGGSGTINYLAKFTAATTLGDSIIYDDGTNVGIGTTSPGAKLTVAGSAQIIGHLYEDQPFSYAGKKIVIISSYVTKTNEYKGELHTHTTNSDGTDTPTALETAYKDAGYDFVAITDHDYLTPDPNVSGILHINGVEETATEGHIISIGTSAQTDLTPAQDIIDYIIGDDAVPSMAHPNASVAPSWTDTELESIDGYLSIEVYSGGGLAEDKWDALLTKYKRAFGMAVDDCHDVAGSYFNKGWVKVFADSLTSSDIVDALKRGNFYSSTGSTLSISVSKTTITATTNSSSTITWIGSGGNTLQSASNVTSDSYTVIGNEVYVRVKITRDSDSKNAWANPIYIYQTPTSELSKGGLIRGNTYITGNVGIGTTAPNVSGYSGTVLTVGKGETSLVSAVEIYGQRSGDDGTIGADLTFLNASATGSDKRVAIIRGLRLGDDDSGGLRFYSRDAGSLVIAVDINNSGNVGIGTTSPTNILSLGNAAAQKFWIENSATDVVGRALTVAAGGTIAGTSVSDVTGGNLILQAGLGTGTGASTISFQTGTTLTTGTTLQTMSTKMTILGSGNVGIGTTAPNVSGYSGTVLTVGKGETSLVSAVEIYGQRSGDDGSIGAELTFLNISAPGSGSDKRIAMIRGIRSGGSDNSGGLKFYTRNEASWSILTIENDGDVGIGTQTPGYKLDVAGEAHATGFPTSSDIRFKDNVVEITNVLEKLEKVRGVTFEWNDLYESLGRAVPGTQMGMIAQELEQVYPELVTTWSADGVDDYRGIEYGRFSAVLLEGLKELHGEVEELREIIGPLDGEGAVATDNQLLITDYSITGNFIARIKQALASLGIFIENGIAKVKRLIAEVVQLDKLEIRDQATGEIYCTWIEQGEWVKQLGECQDIVINPEVQPSVDYGAGTGDNTSENQPESSENQLEEESVPEEPPAEEQPTEELPTEEEITIGETAQEAVEEELSTEEPVQEEVLEESPEESPEVESPITEEPVTGESVMAD